MLSPERLTKRSLPGDAASTAAPGCAALAGLRNPCRLWRRSLRRKPPEGTFSLDALAIYTVLRRKNLPHDLDELWVGEVKQPAIARYPLEGV